MPVADIFDYALNHKIISFGLLVAILAVIALVRLIAPLAVQWWSERRRSEAPQTQAEAADQSAVQQTSVRDVKAGGDISVGPTQVVSRDGERRER